MTEEENPRPYFNYGVSKLQAEQLVGGLAGRGSGNRHPQAMLVLWPEPARAPESILPDDPGGKPHGFRE